MCHLFDRGPAQPSEIATSVSRPLPHISRSIAELRDRDLIDLLVPEDTLKGRLYGLTPTGRDVVWDVFRRTEDISFTTVTRDAFPYDDLLSFLIDHAGTALRGVVAYTRESVTMYVHTPATVSRTESAVAETLRDVATDVLAENPNRLSDKLGSLTYAVQGFDTQTILQLPFTDNQQVLVSFDSSVTLSLPAMARTCRAQLA